MNMEQVTKTEIRNFLKSLGETPNEIAQSIENMGVLGYRHDCHKCPIARAIMRKFGTLGSYASVRSKTIVFVHECGRTEPLYIDLSYAAVIGFISQFDLGVYPKLIDGKEWQDMCKTCGMDK